MIGVAAGDCEVVVLSSDDECQKKQLQEDWIPFEDLKEPFPEESDSDSQERKSRKKLKRKSKSVEEDDRRQRRQEKLLEARENKETTDSDSLTLLSQPPRKKKKEKHLVPKLIQTNQKVLKKKKKLKVVGQEETDKKMTPQERDAAAASPKVKKKKKQTKPSPCSAKDGSLPLGRPSFVPDSIFLETDYVYGFSEKDARDWWESSPDRGHSFSLENILEEITTSLVPVLRQGLRQRVKSIVGPKLLKAASDGSSYVVLGLVVDEDHCYDVIDKVEAGTAEAKDFVELWGQTELRRFADGQLFECVLWGESTYTHHQRRRIVHAIVRRLCRLRSFPEVRVLSGGADLEFLTLQHNPLSSGDSTGEELLLRINQVFDGLARTLRSLTLPLPITRVTLLPPCLSDLPTPRPRPCDSPVTSLKVHIAFERSGKWPDSLPALMKLKTAFYLAIMKQLSHKPKSEVQHFRAFSDHLLVAKDGFVFRVTAVPPNEVALRQRTVVLPGGVIHRYPTASSKAYHRETVLIPRIASALESLRLSHPCFLAGLSLVDHWLSSQFLSPPFSPPLFSLLYASLFLRPSHKEGAVNHPPPGSPSAAFFRFLHLLQATDFHQTPIILNFNDELTEDGVLDLEAALLTKMTSGRTSLPPIVLATPWDTSGDVWSRSGAGGPSKMMLNRAQAVSRAAVRSLAAVPPSTKRTLALFRADLSPYDLVLHVGLTTLCSSAMRELQRQHISQFPFLVDVDPAEELFDFLKATLVDVAMVLRRSRATFTGKSSSSESYVIAIMWRPDAFTRRFPYNSKTSTLRPGFILEELDGKWSTRLSRDAILTWIQTFGKGLIQHTAVKEK